MIIVKERTNFQKFENPAKLPVGPTTLRPGPTFDIQLKVAVKLVTKSKPANEIINVTKNNKATYTIMKLSAH